MYCWLDVLLLLIFAKIVEAIRQWRRIGFGMLPSEGCMELPIRLLALFGLCIFRIFF